MCRNALFHSFLVVVVALIAIAWPAPANAQRVVEGGTLVRVPAIDLDAIRVEDEHRDLDGLAPRFAIPHATIIRPSTDGVWDDRDPVVRRWSLRIESPGALSLNLGFTAYYMPEGGELRIGATDGSYDIRPFTAADNAPQGELWTPVVLADDITIEVWIPRAVADELLLELTSVNVGYRGFGETRGDRSGSCNIDVICPAADAWRNEISAVGVISTGGSTFCTGFMVNNTAQDQRPLFMTANHCGISSGNASSLVVYWNFQSPSCGQHGGGQLNQFNTGSTFRATYSASDFTLVELNQPPNEAYNVTYAGWDRSDVNATSVVGIHHPDTDEKSISFSPNPSTITSYLSDSVPGDSTHVRVMWLPASGNQGVIEPGSSGSPIFDQNHRVLGQLHGGYSACGNSDMRDWYGRIFRSWTGGGTSASRLSDWLDAGNTGALQVNTLISGRCEVAPAAGLSMTGEAGGPFTPDGQVYTMTNLSATAISYSVAHGAPWLSATNASGTLPGQASVDIAVSLNASAEALDPGQYSDLVSFTNLTNHQGDTSRSVSLQVGAPVRIYNFPLDGDPGWTTAGQWAFGPPAGEGGAAHGLPDPSSGHTGASVFGVNLAGDYTPVYGGPYYLTAGPLDLSDASDATLKFWRWLNSDYQPYVNATVQVSNNGTAWVEVWSNGTSVSQANAWSLQEYNLGATADHQSTVWIRWGYRIGNGAYAYSGWNIDDIEIWGFAPPAPPLCIGDLNCDGQVGFTDINPFVLFVADSASWAATYAGCNPLNGDINGDGTYPSFRDINAFVELLSSAELPIVCP